MKLAWFVFVLAVFHIPSASALSPLMEIEPKRDDRFPLTFQIRSERVEEGAFKFTVRVSEGTIKLRSEFYSTLSAVHITTNSMSSKFIRRLPCTLDQETIVCTFTVTDLELQNPDLAFYFSMPVPGHPATDHFYARLTKFLEP